MSRNESEELIDAYGRMSIALEELESCYEFAALIPEVRTNMVFALQDATTTDDVLAVEGRITIISGMPRASGRIRFGASGHVARLILNLKETDPAIRSAIDFANPPGFTGWLSMFCRQNNWTLAMVDRKDEPADLGQTEGMSMSWKAGAAIRSAGGRVPKIICDAGGPGKEPVCIIVGREPIGIARDLCAIARAYGHRDS